MKEVTSVTKTNYRSFSRKMILTVLIASFTPLILVSGILLYQFHNSHSQKVMEHINTLVLKHKFHIDGFLKEKLGDLHYLVQSNDLNTLRDEADLREKLSLLQEAYGRDFQDLGVITAEGIQISYAGPYQLIGADYGQEDWFQEALEKDEYISDVFLGKRGHPHFIMTIKRETPDGPWLFRTTIDFGAFNSLVENLRVGGTGFAYILNRQGEFQTKSLPRALSGQEAMEHLIGQERKNRDGVYIGDIQHGAASLFCAATYLKNGDWLLVFQQDLDDAFAEPRAAIAIALAILLFGGLGIVISDFTFARKAVGRIEKADKEKEMMSRQVVESGKLASIGELAAGIAHEINNPVAIMMESAGWVRDLLEEEEFKKRETSEEIEKTLRQITTQGFRCKELTAKLLSFARRSDSKVHNVHIDELVEDIVGISAERGKHSGISIVENISPELPVIQASHSEMQQVLMNLVNNAMDAMEYGGGTLTITVKSDNDHMIMEVSDTGPGIAEANLNRIFDPFFTTKAVGEGSGLGLSICYSIVEKMGGQIIVHSAMGKGATFIIRLPLQGTPGSNSNPEHQGEKQSFGI